MERSAKILFKDQSAGILTEMPNGGTRFVYNPEWQQDIACSLPVTRREHEWPHGLHPFFQHLGPEGWLREKQARVAHIQEENDLGLLLNYGADCIGAVSVRPVEDSPHPAPITEATANPGRTLSGVQKKLLVTRVDCAFQPAGATGDASYIAKFNSPNIDTMVRNELLSLRWITKILGKNEVNECCIKHVAALDEMALIVTRFDRGAGGEKWRLEDFAQILNRPRGRDYDGKYQGDYEEIAGAISQYSARPVIDLDKFFRRLIAFVVIGNCDAHLKNFSLLERPEGLRLSPVYDVLNTALYPDLSQSLALNIEGQKRPIDEVDRACLQNFGRAIGLTNAAIDLAFADMRKNIAGAEAIITPPDAEGPDGFISRFKEGVDRRCVTIWGG
jgi:serine/threonine-protein kinase HipA